MKKKRTLSTTQIIMLSFLAVILIGSLLLSLPISAANGESVAYLDALFTATTATCVTGLVTLPTATAWSVGCFSLCGFLLLHGRESILGHGCQLGRLQGPYLVLSPFFSGTHQA